MNEKVALLSGASRGIGRALALRLAREGYAVVLLARQMQELSQLAEEIDAAGGKSLPIAVDIADEQQVEAAVQQAVETLGRIDAVINNAGVGVFKNADAISHDEWAQVMDVNVKGTFLLTKAALPHLLAGGSGHVVGIASDVSKRTFAGGSLYTASKYAQHAYFESLRREVRSKGVKVSVIYPGLVDTHFHRSTEGDPAQAEFLKPADIADAVAYVLNAPAHVLIDELMLHPMSQEW